ADDLELDGFHIFAGADFLLGARIDDDGAEILDEHRSGVALEWDTGGGGRSRHAFERGLLGEQVEAEGVGETGRDEFTIAVERAEVVLAHGEDGPTAAVPERFAE